MQDDVAPGASCAKSCAGEGARRGPSPTTTSNDRLGIGAGPSVLAPCGLLPARGVGELGEQSRPGARDVISSAAGVLIAVLVLTRCPLRPSLAPFCCLSFSLFAQLEKEIFDLEGAYIEDTTSGNILKGWMGETDLYIATAPCSVKGTLFARV